MDETQIDKAEQLLGYLEQHGEQMTYGAEAAHREWWMGDAAALLRDLLPDWSAFKDEPARHLPKLAALMAEADPWGADQ